MKDDQNPVKHAADLIVPHAARLTLYARQWLDFAGACDVVQEALISLLSQRVCPQNPLAWMYAAVRNGAIDAARADSRRRRREQKTAGQRHELFQPVMGDDEAQAAQLALSKLPVEQREIVVLRIWSGLGFEEIARLTNLSVGTVHQRYTDALKKMRADLSLA